MTESKTRIRMKILAAVVVFMFGALTTRLWFLQVLATDQFTRQADQNQLRLVPITPLRGQIMDRNGNVLVGNIPSTVVLVDRSELQGQGDRVLYRLATLLHIPIAQVVARLNSVKYSPYQPVPVAEGVSKEQIFYIEEHHSQFPGVSYRLDSERTYTQGDLAAHILGYLGPISADQLKEKAFAGYQSSELVGQSGVEASYERWLHGTDGFRAVQVDAQGKVLDTEAGGTLPKQGDNLVLAIDERTQRLAEQSLNLGIQLARNTPDKASERYLSATGGAAIVMDPRNGQVLALASNPTFDPSVFLNGLSNREASVLDLNPRVPPSHNEPFLDRAIQGLYPPGSTFKPFVAASAMKEGYAGEGGRYNCPAGYIAPIDIQKHVFHNWDPVNLGYITLPEALTISCDTVFYQFGYDFWVHYIRSGKQDELFQRDLGQMGFGQFTRIDLPGEQPGRIPTEAYVHGVVKSNPQVYGKNYYGWLPGDSLALSIGQGFITVTPLQIATAFSAIANGGTLWQPHVGLRLENPDGKTVVNVTPRMLGKLPIARRKVLYLRNALTQVPVTGTAAAAFAGFPFSQVPVAGKTGTADIPPKQPISWFAAMAPANNPRYVVVAMVEQGGHGATTAAPIVRRILEGLFGLQTPGKLQAGNVVD